MTLTSLALVSSVVLAQPAPVTRQDIMARADTLSRLSWQMAESNRKGTGANCPASYVSDYTPGPQVGMPYKWGGFDDEASFRQGLSVGRGAGSHQSHGVLGCVVGQDCSGFVSRAWRLPQHVGTSRLNETGRGIRAAELQPGDAMNKPGSHVVLFAAFRDDGVPIFFEASGSASKVRLNTNASWAYLNGYSGLRYSGLADENPTCVGTSQSPLEIASFPFKDARSTFLACSDRFDEYSCKRGSMETGREFIYRLVVPERATVVAKVADSSETDIDLHLLSKLDSDACLTRADSTLRWVVDPGTYFLVADTWTDQESLERSGQYSLEVKLEAPPAPPDAGAVAFDAGGAAPVAVRTDVEPPSPCGCQASSSSAVALLASAALIVRAVRRRKSLKTTRSNSAHAELIEARPSLDRLGENGFESNRVILRQARRW